MDNYHIDPVELKELNNQLQDLLGKSFIKLSVSTWGALVLFLKKKGYLYVYKL